jgi:hypothetical protein
MTVGSDIARSDVRFSWNSASLLYIARTLTGIVEGTKAWKSERPNAILKATAIQPY